MGQIGETGSVHVSTRRVQDETADALDLFSSALRNFPPFEHEESIARFRALRAADSDFRSALYAIPRTAELLVGYWHERKARGLTTGLMLEDFEGGSAAKRSQRAEALFGLLEGLCDASRQCTATASTGTATQAREALTAEPVSLTFLRRAHSEIKQERERDSEGAACELAAGDALGRANSSRVRWEALRSELVTRNLRLVVNVAKRFRRSDAPLLELVQEGAIGLNRAIEKFDPERGFRFSTYGVWWIEQAVIRGVQKCARSIRLPSHVHEQQVRFKHLQSKANLAGFDGDARIAAADEMGLSDREADLLFSTLAPIQSLQRPLDETGERTVQDTIEDPREGALEDTVYEHELRGVLDQSFESLSPREKRVLEWRFGFENHHPESLESIGGRLGLSRERVRQIERDALVKLRDRPEIRALAESLPGGGLQ